MEPPVGKGSIGGDITGLFQPQAGRENGLLHGGARLCQLLLELFRGGAPGVHPDKDRGRLQRIEQEAPGCLLAILLHQQLTQLLRG